MATHPFRLLKKRNIEFCNRRAETAVHSWAHDWQPAANFTVVCGEAIDPRDSQPDGVWIAYRAARGMVWCYRPTDLQQRVRDLLFGQDKPQANQSRLQESTVADAVAAEAMDNLLARLLEQLVVSSYQAQDGDAAPPAWYFSHHSGTALINISLGEQALYLVVPHEQFPRHDRNLRPPQRSPVEPLITALSNVPVRLTARLDEMEISLGNFMSIKQGDVLKLPAKLDQPLRVCTNHSQPIALAHLGRQADYRAIDIFKAPHL